MGLGGLDGIGSASSEREAKSKSAGQDKEGSAKGPGGGIDISVSGQIGAVKVKSGVYGNVVGNTSVGVSASAGVGIAGVSVSFEVTKTKLTGSLKVQGMGVEVGLSGTYQDEDGSMADFNGEISGLGLDIGAGGTLGAEVNGFGLKVGGSIGAKFGNGKTGTGYGQFSGAYGGVSGKLEGEWSLKDKNSNPIDPHDELDLKGAFPIILDLDGDGVETISAKDSNAFFNYGNGEAKSATTGQEYVVKTGWVGADDGILVYDFDDSGTVNDPFEIVFTKYLQGAKTDLEGLRGLDDNKDGKLDDKDKAWAKFKIWQDKNQNGIVDQGEMVAATAFGLAFINLIGDGKASVQNGNLIAQHTEYGTIDGQIHQVGDVGFGFELQLYERGQVKDAGLSSGNHVSGQVEVHVTDSIINTSPKLDEVHSPVIYQDGVFASVPVITPTNSNLGVPGSNIAATPPSVASQPLPPEGGSPIIENGPLISEKPGVQVQGPKDVVVFQPGGNGGSNGDNNQTGNSGNSTPPQDYRLPAFAANDVMEGIEDQTLSFSADDLLKNDRTDYGHLEIIGIDHVKGGRVEWVSPSASPALGTSPFLIGPQASGRAAGFASIIELKRTLCAGNPTRLGASGDGGEQAIPSVPSGATSPASEGGESGHYVFIPDEDFSGEASFDYWIRDEAGNVSQASAKIDVRSVNDAPLAKEALYVTMKEDGARSFTLDQLLKPILDKDGDVLSVGKIMNVTGGKLEWVSSTLTGSSDTPTQPSPIEGGGLSGHYIFTGTKDYNGIGGFAYEVSDGKGGKVIQYVTVNIAAVNDLPSMISQPKTMEEDKSLSFKESDLLQGASDIDGDVLSVTGISNVKGGHVEWVAPSGGSATTSPASEGGQYIFIADKDFNGEAGFDYQISDGKGEMIINHAIASLQKANSSNALASC